jgi:hypothetical protein
MYPSAINIVQHLSSSTKEIKSQKLWENAATVVPSLDIHKPYIKHNEKTCPTHSMHTFNKVITALVGQDTA